MSAKEELIAAALTVAGAVRWQYPELSDELRELCARAMVPPDMAEVERLLEAYDREYASGGSVEDYDRARTALLDYVRNIIAERDAAEMVPAGYRGAKVGTEDGGEAYSAGYFDGRSAAAVLMPPKCHPLHKLGQRLAELLDENQWAECERLLLECWKHEQKPSAAEVPMPQGYAERPADYSGGIWIESQMRQYGDAREGENDV